MLHTATTTHRPPSLSAPSPGRPLGHGCRCAVVPAPGRVGGRGVPLPGPLFVTSVHGRSGRRGTFAPVCLCGYAPLRLCASVPVRIRAYASVCLCGYMPVCKCGYAPVCLCGYVHMWVCVNGHMCLCVVCSDVIMCRYAYVSMCLRADVPIAFVKGADPRVCRADPDRCGALRLLRGAIDVITLIHHYP